MKWASTNSTYRTSWRFNVSFTRFFILVEGPDDSLLFKQVVVPELEKRFDFVLIYEYSKKGPKAIRRLLKSIKQMKADYLYVADINMSPCVTAKKSKVLKQLEGDIDIGKAVIVVKEIESWYLAGLTDSKAQNMVGKVQATTDKITKEQFNKLIPKKFTRTDFMQEVLKTFSPATAAKKNKSFKYFKKKLSL